MLDLISTKLHDSFIKVVNDMTSKFPALNSIEFFLLESILIALLVGTFSNYLFWVFVPFKSLFCTLFYNYSLQNSNVL